MEKLRVLIADDHEVLRQGVRAMIEKKPGWEVCAEAADGRTAVDLAAKLTPHVVILDLAMPELGGMEATRQIKRILPETEVLIFTGHESEQVIHAVFEAGVRSYIMKSDTGPRPCTSSGWIPSPTSCATPSATRSPRRNWARVQPRTHPDSFTSATGCTAFRSGSGFFQVSAWAAQRHPPRMMSEPER